MIDPTVPLGRSAYAPAEIIRALTARAEAAEAALRQMVQAAAVTDTDLDATSRMLDAITAAESVIGPQPVPPWMRDLLDGRKADDE